MLIFFAYFIELVVNIGCSSNPTPLLGDGYKCSCPLLPLSDPPPEFVLHLYEGNLRIRCPRMVLYSITLAYKLILKELEEGDVRWTGRQGEIPKSIV